VYLILQPFQVLAELKEKSLPVAISLNLLLPGTGYLYMGKIVVGIGAMLLVHFKQYPNNTQSHFYL
jgi:hypothetical protein